MINLENLILHIVDPTVGSAIISEDEHPEDDSIFEYMEKHIEKSFTDIDIKELDKIGNETLTKMLENLKEKNMSFLEITEEVVEDLYRLFATAEQDGFDLVCARFTKDRVDFLGFFLLNYRNSFIHSIDNIEDKSINRIVKQNSALPSSSQKINEFIIFNLDDGNIILKEKKYNIDGDREFILSTYLLKTNIPLSPKDKVDIVNRTSKMIVKDFYNDDVNKLAEINSILLESVEDTGSINLDRINSQAFENNYEVQSAYIEEVEKKGIYERNIEVDESLIGRLPKTQRIVLDDGFEIRIPVEYLNNKDKVEFIVNENGSISIVLKNLRELQNK